MPHATGGDGGPVLASRPLRPHPHRSIRPWAGHRLGSEGELVGELWLAGPESIAETSAGPRTLDEVAGSDGEAFIGRNGMRLLGPRFPLLVKLIDAAEWLSLQVHPDDALAAELFGPRALGKAEAWLVLDAEARSELVTGAAPDLAEEGLLAAVASGELGRDGCETRACMAGETFFLSPGTLHAIGAGCFIYEIEQPSDITFRISDWGRPETPDRPLHRTESGRAIRPSSRARLVGRAWGLDGGALTVREFQLELLQPATEVVRGPAGASVEILTAIRGGLEVVGDGWREALEPYDTLVVPASIADYRVSGSPGSLACLGTIP